MRTFYWYFRPLAVYFKSTGSFPIQNVLSLDTTQLKFCYFSCSHLYSCGIFIFSTYLLFILNGIIGYTTKLRLICVVIYILMGRSVASSLMFGANSYRLLPNLIQLLDNFDRRITEIVKEQPSSRKQIFLYTILPAMFTVGTLIGSFQLCMQMMNTLFANNPEYLYATKMRSATLLALIINMQMLLSFQYMYFARHIANRFKEINKTVVDLGISQDYATIALPKYCSDLDLVLSKIRILHNMLNESASQLGTIFGSFIVMDHLFFIGIFVVNVSVLIIYDKNVTCLIFLTIQYGIVVIGVIQLSQGVKDSVSN